LGGVQDEDGKNVVACLSEFKEHCLATVLVLSCDNICVPF
jgi:hypothetical protein